MSTCTELAAATDPLIRENFFGENRVFGILQNVNFLDLAVVKSHSNSDVAVFAHADASVVIGVAKRVVEAAPKARAAAIVIKVFWNCMMK